MRFKMLKEMGVEEIFEKFGNSRSQNNTSFGYALPMYVPKKKEQFWFLNINEKDLEA